MNLRLLIIKQKVRFLIVLLLPMLFIGCKHQYDNGFYGPEFIPAPEGFKVNEFNVTADRADFQDTSKSIDFTATFSHKVSFQLQLRGLSSGAKKLFKGVGSGLTLDDAIFWKGGHDDFYFFRKNEKVVAELSFYGIDEVLRDTITVVKEKKFGSLITSFNDLLKLDNGLFLLQDEFGNISGGPPYFFHFPKEGSDGFDEIKFNQIDSVFLPIEGKFYYTMEGTDNNSNYFIAGAGGVQFPMDKSGLNINRANAGSLYFNIYVYSYGVTGSRFLITFKEDDNGDKAFDPLTEDAVKLEILVPDQRGWYLYSKKYTDIGFSQDKGDGDKGNRVYEPFKLEGVNFALLTNAPKTRAKVSFDYPIFTFGKPLETNR